MSRSQPLPGAPRRPGSEGPLAGYSVREAAGLVGVTEARIRSWVKAGFLMARAAEGKEIRLAFQDLVLLRTAKELAAAKIPARRIRIALERLREQLPQERPLSAVRILADGARLLARDELSLWIPESGQALFDFSISELAREAAPIARRSAERLREERELDAEDWYRLGCELEETDAEQAREAYVQALAREPAHPDAHLNLGRLLHEGDDPAAAEAHYRAALAARPADATAGFNLGVALEDLGRLDEAAARYRAVLEADPDYADAHYNLAGIAIKLDHRAEAIRHLSAYKHLLDRRA